MGSLMAGWDSPVQDPKAVTYQRNRSFTKGEIEAYWKSKKRIEEEHLKSISNSPQNSQESLYQGSESGSAAVLQRSSSLPLTVGRQDLVIGDSNTDVEKLRKTSDWWTRSNWAFLNVPPVTAMEGPSYKYASQYHVASVSNSKPDVRSGISA
ncbi:uncharacterized protein LOC131237963 isoform X2 [Magnolia sinica]|uniref:uncharacterized protein LOC131237963 isoform X2 n=1 Tax=Magnolia sinica TaxID=86752 RepID=UPI0026599B16|nr:uncharacterized protein LOC131237963 isoform X2 [Magnolia sinica]